MNSREALRADGSSSRGLEWLATHGCDEASMISKALRSCVCDRSMTMPASFMASIRRTPRSVRPPGRDSFHAS
jgi:hypothetical protein